MKYLPYVVVLIAFILRISFPIPNDSEVITEFQAIWISSLLVKKIFDILCETRIGQPLKNLFKLEWKYSGIILVALLFTFIYYRVHHVTTSILFCYFNYGIVNLYNLIVSFMGFLRGLIATNEPVVAEPVAAEPAEAEPGEAEPELIQLEPKVYPPSDLATAIGILNQWIERNRFNALASHPPVLRNYFETSLKNIAKSLIIELFTTDRDTRLKSLIKTINDPEQDSYTLTNALSRIIAQSLGFPEKTDTSMDSFFQFVEPMLLKAFQSCRDSFVCDFILYNLLEYPTVNLVLRNDVDENGVSCMIRNDDPEIYKDIDLLLEANFMQPMVQRKLTVKSIAKRALFYVKKWVGVSQYNKSTQTVLFDRYIDNIVKGVKRVNADLNDQMKKQFFTRLATPPANENAERPRCPSSPPSRWTKNHPDTMKIFKDDILNPPSLSPEDLNEVNRRLEREADDRRRQQVIVRQEDSSIETDDPEVIDGQEDGSIQTDDDEDDPEVIMQFLFEDNSDTVANEINPNRAANNANPNRAATEGYWGFLNEQDNIVPIQLVSGKELGLFEDIVKEMRLLEAQSHTRLRELMTSYKIRRISQLYELSLLGLTSNSTTETLGKLREAFLLVTERVKLYRDYLLRYEKGYIVRQLISFVKMYKSEINRVVDGNTRSKRLLNGPRVISLKKLTITSTCITWNLKYVYDRFASFEPELYRKELYKVKVETLFNEIFRMGRDNIRIERQYNERINLANRP